MPVDDFAEHSSFKICNAHIGSIVFTHSLKAQPMVEV